MGLQVLQQFHALVVLTTVLPAHPLFLCLLVVSGGLSLPGGEEGGSVGAEARARRSSCH